MSELRLTSSYLCNFQSSLSTGTLSRRIVISETVEVAAADALATAHQAFHVVTIDSTDELKRMDMAAVASAIDDQSRT